jgi:hypothetical protein
MEDNTDGSQHTRIISAKRPFQDVKPIVTSDEPRLHTPGKNPSSSQCSEAPNLGLEITTIGPPKASIIPPSPSPMLWRANVKILILPVISMLEALSC